MSKLGKWAITLFFVMMLVGLCPATAWAESADEGVNDAQLVSAGDIVVGDDVTATFDKDTGTVTFYSDGGTLWSDWVDKSGIVWVGIEKIRVAEGGKVFLPTDSKGLFKGLKYLSEIDLSEFDLSNVVNMESMFRDCSSLAKMELIGLDTSNIESMSYMFSDCSSLTSLNMSKLNLPALTRMDYMFIKCSALTTLNLNELDTPALTRVDGIFAGCKSLTTLNISGLDTPHVTNMTYMFEGCSSLNSLDLSNLDTSNVERMGYMFYQCSSLNTLDLSGLNTSNVTDMSGMFAWCTNLVTVNLRGIDTSRLTNMYYMFYHCSSLTNLDLSGVDTKYVTDMRLMLSWCDKLITLNLSGLDTSHVQSMNEMFSECSSLTSLDLSGFDTSRVTNMSHIFSDCKSLTSLNIDGFDTSYVTDMSGMFYGCNSLTTLDISEFDTSRVTSMELMFAGCNNLSELDLSKFDTSKVTNMQGMFSDCSSLTSLDLRGFNTSNVATMMSMFGQCNSLISLNISGFDLSNVDNMGNMFEECNNLTTLDLRGLNTSKVTNMSYMFSGCNNLLSLNLNGLDTSNVISMSYMFERCNNLLEIDMSSQETTNLMETEYMFFDCSNLTTLDLSGFDMTNVYSSESMLENCSNLKVFKTPKAMNPEHPAIILPCTMYDSEGQGYGEFYKQSGSITLTTPTPVEGVSLNKESITLKRGESSGIIATVYPETAFNKTVRWSSRDKRVATVDASGIITTLKVGTTDIIARTVDGGFTAICNLTVTAPDVSGVNLSQNEMTLKRGETATLTATVEPYDAENKSVIWSSSDETVAAVDENGRISTLKIGETDISATTADGNFVAVCKLKVIAPKVSSIVLESYDLVLKRGEVKTLGAVIEPYDAEGTIIWESDDENVATIDENGSISALSVGFADISATLDEAGLVEHCYLTVVAPDISGISINPQTITLKRGEMGVLNAEVEPYDAEPRSVIWTSSDENVATVDESGIITTLKVGTTDIMATTVDGGFTATCNLTVAAPNATGITLSQDELALKRGENSVLSATVEPYDAENKSVTWSSSDETIAAVDESGTITTLKVGMAEIIVTTVDGGFTATCNLTVVAPTVTGITLSQDELALKRGENSVLSATVEPYDAENKSVTWSSSDETVATVDESGNVTTLKVGTADIIATTADGGFTSTCTLTVTSPDVTGISLDAESASIYEGKTLQLSAFITPKDANQDVIWSSSDDGIATVDQNGLVTALREGSAVITATSAEGGFAAVCNITVKKKVTFTDVMDQNAWYYDSVYWAVENGITSGMGEGTFQPMAKLSRAQAVTFLYNLAGRPDVNGLQAKEFTDVSNTAWYYNAVKWAVANKITSGYGTGTFQPNATCNRAMIVTFLANYAKSSGTYKEPMTSSNFKDVKANDWFKTSVDWAVENGITSGYGQGTFSPNVTCNRAMMVTFLKKVAALPKV